MLVRIGVPSSNMFITGGHGLKGFGTLVLLHHMFVVVYEENKSFSILEVACSFQSSLEEAFMTKVIKYQSPLQPSQTYVYIGAIYLCSSLAALDIRRLVVRGLQQLGMPKSS